MIEIENVSKKYPLSKKQRIERKSEEKEFFAVNQVNLTAEAGRVLTILGPNGAGKTTLLRMLATLIAPSAGSIKVAGHDTRTASEKARGSLGFLTGSAGLYDRLTPYESLHYFANLQGMSEQSFKFRCQELIESLRLEEFLHRPVGKLSTGMKQRVSIARTLIHDPQVIIFDEPTSGLDVVASRDIMDLVARSKKAGKTILFSTHRMDEVNLLSDDLAIINKGRLILHEPYINFKERAQGSTLESLFIKFLEEQA